MFLSLVFIFGIVSLQENDPPKNVSWDRLDLSKEITTDFDDKLLPCRVRNLDSTKIRIRGYFYPGSVFSRRGITRFALIGEVKSKDAIIVKAGSDLPLDSIMWVEMKDGSSTVFTPGPIAVTGHFTIKPFKLKGKVWYVYHLIADSVEAVEKRKGFGRAFWSDL